MSLIRPSRPRRTLCRFLAAVALLFAVFAMHAMGDHDLNGAGAEITAPSAAAVPGPMPVAMPMGGSTHSLGVWDVALPMKGGEHGDGHSAAHAADTCLALLGISAGLWGLGGAVAFRRRAWRTAGGHPSLIRKAAYSLAPPRRRSPDLSMWGVCLT